MNKYQKRFLVKYETLLKDKHFGEIFSGSMLVMVSKSFATILALIASIVIARFYGAEVVGILAIFDSYFAVVTVFSLMGTNTSILRLIPEYSVKYSPYAAKKLYYKTFRLIATITIILGVILFFTADLISDTLFSRPDLTFLFMLAAGVLLFRTFQQFSLQGIRALNRIKAYAFFNSLRPALFLILLGLFSVFSFNIYIPVYLQFLAFILVAIASTIYLYKVFSKTSKGKESDIIISNAGIFRISWPMFLTSSVTVIMGNVATLLLGIFNNEAEVGYYSIAFKIASLTVFILVSINTVVGPKFAELFHSGKIDELFVVARKSTKLIFWSVLPLLLIFVFFGNTLIVKLYGIKFEVCYLPLLILTIGMFVSAISGSVGYFMNMCGYEKQFKNIMLIALLSNIILNVLLTPNYGAIGAAIATSITLALWNILATIFIYRKYSKIFIYSPKLFNF